MDINTNTGDTHKHCNISSIGEHRLVNKPSFINLNQDSFKAIYTTFLRIILEFAGIVHDWDRLQ